MSLLNRVFILVLVTIASFSAAIPSAVAQGRQDGVTATSAISDAVIDLGSSGEAGFVEGSQMVEMQSSHTRESLQILYGTTWVYIDFIQGDVEPGQYFADSEPLIAVAYSYTEWLGGEVDSTTTWNVYSGAFRLDFREIVYLEYTTDAVSDTHLGIGVYASESTLAPDMEWLNANVTIDGEPILQAANSETLNSVLDGSAGFQTEEVLRPITSIADWETAGLVSETEWQSPISDRSFSWDGDTWVFPFHHFGAVVISEDDGSTVLRLEAPERRGEVLLRSGTSDFTPEEFVEAMTSEEWLQSQRDAGARLEVLDTATSDNTGSVIYMQYTGFGDAYIMILDFFVEADGQIVITQLSATQEDVGAVYADFWDNVQSNGDYYPLTWTLEEIEALSNS